MVRVFLDIEHRPPALQFDRALIIADVRQRDAIGIERHSAAIGQFDRPDLACRGDIADRFVGAAEGRRR